MSDSQTGEVDEDFVGADVAPGTGPDVEGLAAVKAFGAFEGGSLVIATHHPAVGSRFESGVGDEVRARAGDDLDVVEQTLALFEEHHVQGRGRVAAVVEDACRLEVSPRGFAAFIAIGPVRRASVVGTGID